MASDRVISKWLLCPSISVAAHWGLVAKPGSLFAASQQPQCPKAKDVASDELDKIWQRMETWGAQFRLGIILFKLGPIVLLWLPLLKFMWPVIGEHVKAGLRCVYSVAVKSLIKLHTIGALEPACYLFAWFIGARSCLYPSEDSELALAMSLLDGLLFLPCLTYTLSRHRHQSLRVIITFGAMSWASVLAPLAIVQRSSLLGAFATFAAYCGIVAACFGECSLTGIKGAEGVWRIAIAYTEGSMRSSGILVVCYLSFWTACQVAALDGSILSLFAAGVVTFGHVAYFLSAIGLASSSLAGNDVTIQYVRRQAFVVVPLACACIVGWLREKPSLSGTGITFVSLWLLAKGFEWEHMNAGAKLVAAYMILQYLYLQAEHVMAAFDPQGFYA